MSRLFVLVAALTFVAGIVLFFFGAAWFEPSPLQWLAIGLIVSTPAWVAVAKALSLIGQIRSHTRPAALYYRQVLKREQRERERLREERRIRQRQRERERRKAARGPDMP